MVTNNQIMSEEIKEQRNSIMKFLGFNNPYKDYWMAGANCEPQFEHLHNTNIEQIEFDKDWRLLMEVLTYIDSTLSEGEAVCIEGSVCVIPVLKYGIDFEGKGETMFEGIYKAILNYVDWYNNERG